MIVALVAAVAHGGVIGRDGGLPWRLPEDMAHFRDVTVGHPVVMGRRTWESLPERFRPLPERRNVVVTRNADWSADGAERSGSLEDAIKLLSGEKRISVIGGGELFAAALPLADELLLTEIHLDVAGDAFFPEWDRDAYVETLRAPHTSADGTSFEFVTYRALASIQLTALADVHELLTRAGLEYWLFGGWAVDFYVGSVTRTHGDVDIAVWQEDLPRMSELLTESGWRHAPEPDEDGGTGYERDDVRLELTYLSRIDDGRVVTHLRDFDAQWPHGAFGADMRELRGVHARVISRDSLTRGKASTRDDADDAAKDRADFDVLSGH